MKHNTSRWKQYVLECEIAFYGKEKLTKEEREYVKKLAVDDYSEYEWEDGGHGKYSEI